MAKIVGTVTSRSVWALIKEAQKYSINKSGNYNVAFKSIMEQMQTSEMKRAIANFVSIIGLKDCSFIFKGEANSPDTRLYRWAMTYC